MLSDEEFLKILVLGGDADPVLSSMDDETLARFEQVLQDRFQFILTKCSPVESLAPRIALMRLEVVNEFRMNKLKASTSETPSPDERTVH